LTFDGSNSSDSDGSIVSYDWDFGDGATGTGVSPSHTYATGGTYIVWLTVTDDGGATGTDTTTATIQNIITGQPSPPSQPDGDVTSPDSTEEVEVKVLKTIKRKNRAVTAVKIELVEDDMRIADTLCGPEGAQLVAPKRLIQKKDGESIAIFRTSDLGIQYDGTQLVCKGTMEPDGTKFMGTSNQLTSGGDVNNKNNEHVEDRHNDDGDSKHRRDRDDD
jgi:PKD domain